MIEKSASIFSLGAGKLGPGLGRREEESRAWGNS